MSSFGFASKITNFTGFDADATQELESSANVRVWGVVLSNTGTTTDAIFSMRSADGTVTYLTQRMASSANFVIDIPFIADAGLSFVLVSGGGAADVEVTVFHGAAGS